MTTTHKSYRKQLLNGGELFINKMGSLFTVDVWDLDSAPGAEPVYHACYGGWDEAMADADLWAAWPINEA